jgi:TonB family protein
MPAATGLRIQKSNDRSTEMIFSAAPLRRMVIPILCCLCGVSLVQASHLSNAKTLRQSEPLKAAIVTVTGVDQKGQAIAPGKGFFVTEYLLATDYLVMKDALQIYVQIAGQETLEARVVGVDERRTIALLGVSGLRATPLQTACPTQPAVGQKYNLMNRPEQLSLAALSKTRKVNGKDYFQLNTALKAEMSGSPLLTQQGEVAGIVVKSAPTEQTISLVVPVSYLSSLLLSRRPCESDKPPLQSSGGVPGGVPGGIPGAFPGGVRGGVVGGVESNDSTSATVVRKAGSVLAGSAIRRAEPLYPPLAKAARVSGAVVVEATVDEEGDVLSARALSGHPLLRDTAVAAARGWKFTATTLDGKPVKVVGTITFNFSL